MRELKFRAWDKENGVYLRPDETFLIAGNGYHPATFSFTFGYTANENLVLEQFTGLYDRDGKEIYEGDIIQEEVDTGDDLLDGIHEYIVVWSEEFLCWGLKGAGFKNDLYEVNRTAEIVGNIHKIPKTNGRKRR